LLTPSDPVSLERAPAYRGEAPALQNSAHAEYKAERIINLPPEIVRTLFDNGLLDESLPMNTKIARPKSARNIAKTWPAPKARRRVTLDDGSYVAEDVLMNVPGRFQYQSWGFSSARGGNVAYSISDYQFLDAGNGTTRFIWTYRMKAKNGFVQRFLDRFVESEFGPFMESGLAQFSLAAGEQ